jgi:hypothetical protein
MKVAHSSALQARRRLATEFTGQLQSIEYEHHGVQGEYSCQFVALDFIPAFVPAVVAPNLLGKQEKLPVDAAAAI